MPVNKHKKTRRMRGSTTHGYGSKKKHRGHGSRGGSGLAGTGKRADSKKPSFWKDTKYFGHYGFERHVTLKPMHTMNILDIERKIDTWTAEKLITKEGDTYVIDLLKLGCEKLLGDGKATHKMKITAKFASGIAIEKIQEAGGSVTATVAKKEKKAKKAETKPAVKEAPKAPAKQEVKPAKAKA